MTALIFTNNALQDDSIIRDAIELEPENIQVSYNDNLDSPYILKIDNAHYFYNDEITRNNDRDLAMAFLLKSMQDEDGVEFLALDDYGDEYLAHIESIKRDTNYSIYVEVIDQEENWFCVPISKLSADGYEIPEVPTLENKVKSKLEEMRIKKIRLGDYVETEFHGYKGRVTGIAQCFDDTNETNSWFIRQEPSYDKEAKMERWISILCHNGGAVLVAESRVNQIGKFDFKNPYADEYFAD